MFIFSAIEWREIKSIYGKMVMKPLLLNAKKRLALSFLSFVLLLTSALVSYAKAGDVAERELLGFSPDGAYFAFEEFGVQDGSGFPYSNIYVINTASNSWVKGSPFRSLIQDEKAPLSAARDKTVNAADSLLKRFKIEPDGQLLAHNPVTEIGSPRDTVTVAPGNAPFLQQHALTFKISSLPLTTKRCDDYGKEAQMGFSLSVMRKDQEAEMVYTDKRIPTSRGCPKRYAISDIVRFVSEKEPEKALYIVLVQVFSYGFEGDDGRYLALSHWMPAFHATN